jgi:hypothetical protein
MGKNFTMRYVPHSEFEALRRFPDYELLMDGTLSRINDPDGREFRIIDETVDRFPLGAMTPALNNELREVYAQSLKDPIAAQENARVAREYLATLDNARLASEELFPPLAPGLT